MTMQETHSLGAAASVSRRTLLSFND